MKESDETENMVTRYCTKQGHDIDKKKSNLRSRKVVANQVLAVASPLQRSIKQV